MEKEGEQKEISQLYDCYGVMLYRLCMVILCNREDAEDAVQETFCAYIRTGPVFESKDHEKAWFIRVATNKCKDLRRSFFWKKRADLEEAEKIVQTPDERELLESMMKLPDKYKIVLHLHYVEGYKIKEIAQMIKLSENNVKIHLYRGRNLLKLDLEKEGDQ